MDSTAYPSQDEQLHRAVRWRLLLVGVGVTRPYNAREVERASQKPEAGPNRFGGSRFDDSSALVLATLKCCN